MNRKLPPPRQYIAQPVAGLVTRFAEVLEISPNEYTNREPTSPPNPLGNAIFSVDSGYIITGSKLYRSPYRRKLVRHEDVGFNLKYTNRTVLPPLRSGYNPFSYKMVSQKNLTRADTVQEAFNESNCRINLETGAKNSTNMVATTPMSAGSKLK